MDNYSEQLVKKARTSGDMAKVVLIISGMSLVVAMSVFLTLLGLFVAILLAAGAVALGVWLLGGIGVEYEYIVTNNELDIDKIIGRRKRKRMITLDLSQTEDFLSYPPEKEIGADTTVHAFSGYEEDAACLIVNHSEYGRVNVIFNPNERTREAIAQEVPKALSARMKDNGE